MKSGTIKTRTASKWLLAIAVTLLFQLQSFAEDSPAEITGGENPTDATVAPDAYVFLLLALGIGYAYYKFKAIANGNRQ